MKKIIVELVTLVSSLGQKHILLQVLVDENGSILMHQWEKVAETLSCCQKFHFDKISQSRT